jgi:hypothetical protein
MVAVSEESMAIRVYIAIVISYSGRELHLMKALYGFLTMVHYTVMLC